MEYVKVADKNELAAGKKIIVKVAGKEVLLANVGGSYYAIPNKCTHLGGPLGKGSLEGNIITCPWHGSQFDVTTGKNVTGATIAFIKMNVKDEPCYPVKVEGNDILVGIA